MKEKFRIAVIQHKYPGRDYEENARDGLLIMKKAADMGADIALFPECFLTGYEFPVANEEALTDSSPVLQKFCRIANELHMGVVITGFTKGAKRPRNTAWVIGKQGNLLMKYSKVHTCDFADEACLESGEDFLVCDFDGVKIGIMICYDREYPESARILMLKGAEMILVPNDCGSMQPRLNALSVRAYENMTGVVMANPPGRNAGCSCAFSPICWDEEGRCIDNTLLLCDEMSDGVFMAEFNLIRLREYRRNEMMGNTFRKVEAYAKLLDGQVQEPFIRR